MQRRELDAGSFRLGENSQKGPMTGDRSMAARTAVYTLKPQYVRQNHSLVAKTAVWTPETQYVR